MDEYLSFPNGETLRPPPCNLSAELPGIQLQMFMVVTYSVRGPQTAFAGKERVLTPATNLSKSWRKT
jgi:hypothetical protein